MEKLSSTHSNISHAESLSKATLWSSNTVIPVVNPLAAAALVPDSEMILADEQQPAVRSSRSSQSEVPKAGERLRRSTTDCSANLYLAVSQTNRKVSLNVGGVRHESKLPRLT